MRIDARTAEFNVFLINEFCIRYIGPYLTHVHTRSTLRYYGTYPAAEVEAEFLVNLLFNYSTEEGWQNHTVLVEDLSEKVMVVDK